MNLILMHKGNWVWEISGPGVLYTAGLHQCLDHLRNQFAQASIWVPQCKRYIDPTSAWGRYRLIQSLNNDYTIINKVRHCVDDRIVTCSLWVKHNGQRESHQYVGAKEYRAWLQSLRLLGFKFNKLMKDVNNITVQDFYGIRMMNQTNDRWLLRVHHQISNSRYHWVDTTRHDTLISTLNAINELNTKWTQIKVSKGDVNQIYDILDLVAIPLTGV